MATDVIMPQMGESIFEGTVTKWLKKPGEKVERDEPLFEISTDKVDAEIPSPAAGVLKEIKVSEGQTVPIQTVVGVIDADGAGAVAAPAPAPAKPQAAAQQGRQQGDDEKASPASAPTKAEAARADSVSPAPAPRPAPAAAAGTAAPPQRPGTEKIR
ncbi:MAG: biotin/lipoyl-containing protein, partial [Candidatus Acidiferrales bacterium]